MASRRPKWPRTKVVLRRPTVAGGDCGLLNGKAATGREPAPWELAGAICSAGKLLGGGGMPRVRVAAMPPHKHFAKCIINVNILNVKLEGYSETLNKLL